MCLSRASLDMAPCIVSWTTSPAPDVIPTPVAPSNALKTRPVGVSRTTLPIPSVTAGPSFLEKIFARIFSPPLGSMSKNVKKFSAVLPTTLPLKVVPKAPSAASAASSWLIPFWIPAWKASVHTIPDSTALSSPPLVRAAAALASMLDA